MADEVVLLDATERKSGQLRRIRLPQPPQEQKATKLRTAVTQSTERLQCHT